MVMGDFDTKTVNQSKLTGVSDSRKMDFECTEDTCSRTICGRFESNNPWWIKSHLLLEAEM